MGPRPEIECDCSSGCGWPTWVGLPLDSRVTSTQVEGMLCTLAGESTAARRRRPGVEPDRADVIVGGTIVLAELMRHFDLDTCLTSEADILDGLVSSLLHE